MINIPFKKGKKAMLITKNEHVILQSFAVTANAGYRREVFKQNGGFDNKLKSGEDMEIYFRMLYKSNFKGIFDPRCKMYHHYRNSFKALMKQWIWYGKGHPRVFCQYGSNGIHIYYPNLKVPKTEVEFEEWHALKKLVTIPFYTCGFIALTPFNLFMSSAFFAFLLNVLGFKDLSQYFLVFSLFSFLLSFFNGVKLKYLRHSLSYSVIRLCLNFCFILTGFLEGLKMKTIFLDISFERSEPTHLEK